jgi:hypothetical protein
MRVLKWYDIRDEFIVCAFAPLVVLMVCLRVEGLI